VEEQLRGQSCQSARVGFDHRWWLISIVDNRSTRRISAALGPGIHLSIRGFTSFHLAWIIAALPKANMRNLREAASASSAEGRHDITPTRVLESKGGTVNQYSQQKRVKRTEYPLFEAELS
jgi:hypothetical protein